MRLIFRLATGSPIINAFTGFVPIARFSPVEVCCVVFFYRVNSSGKAAPGVEVMLIILKGEKV